MCSLPSARIYHCALCHQQVVLCRRCDFGNIYCLKGCADKARKRKCREANCRYRQSHHGRSNAARRQANFRRRQRQKNESLSESEEIVTHQGSELAEAGLLIEEPPWALDNSSLRADLICHRCGRRLNRFLRNGFLPRRRSP